MKQIEKQVIGLVCLILLAIGCNRDEQNVSPTGDNEAVTTATLILTNKAVPTESITATIENLNATVDFTKATLNLRTNTTYTGEITLLNKSIMPTLDATKEIRNLANEHLLVYIPTPARFLAITPTAKDTNPTPGPYPIGLITEIKTGTAGAGKLNVVLRHQPGSKNGTPTPGTSDLDTNFPVVVK
jgi:hypothetical protein